MITGLLAGYVTSELTDSYLWGIVATALFSGVAFIACSDAAATGEQSDGVSDADAQIRNTTFSNRTCSTNGQICNDETYVFEAASGWGGYGWITPEGEQTTVTTQPICLTKDPVNNTLSYKECAYELENGERKVLDSQLWIFRIYASQTQVGNTIVYGSVVNRMINKADDSINISGADAPTIKEYWLGTVFEDRGCRIPPSEDLGICSTKKK